MGKAQWFWNNFKKTVRYLKRNGLKAAGYAAAERLWQERQSGAYEYLPPDEAEWRRQRAEAEKLENPLLLSVAVPAYETPPSYLEALLDCLQAQSWPYWELLLADASAGEGVREAAARRRDGRIRYIRLPANGGIAANTNEAIRQARGAYIGLLDHDDLLASDALYEMAEAIRQSREEGREAVVLYSDEDKCDGEGKRFYEPHRKPDFDADLLLSNNYICHFLVIKADKLKELQLRPGFDGAQDYDLALRACGDAFEGGGQGRYVHIPRILYHWRCHEASTAQNPASKSYAYEAGKRALEDFCAVRGWKTRVEHSAHLGFYRVIWEGDLFAARKDVGAIAWPLPSKGGRLCSGIYDRTDEGVFMRYAGLRRGFSGYMHRAQLPQDVKAADVRAMRVRPGWEAEWEEAKRRIREGEDPAGVSLAFGKRLETAGLRILWLPEARGEDQAAAWAEKEGTD